MCYFSAPWDMQNESLYKLIMAMTPLLDLEQGVVLYKYKVQYVYMKHVLIHAYDLPAVGVKCL